MSAMGVPTRFRLCGLVDFLLPSAIDFKVLMFGILVSLKRVDVCGSQSNLSTVELRLP